MKGFSFGEIVLMFCIGAILIPGAAAWVASRLLVRCGRDKGEK